MPAATLRLGAGINSRRSRRQLTTDAGIPLRVRLLNMRPSSFFLFFVIAILPGRANAQTAPPAGDLHFDLFADDKSQTPAEKARHEQQTRDQRQRHHRQEVHLVPPVLPDSAPASDVTM